MDGMPTMRPAIGSDEHMRAYLASLKHKQQHAAAASSRTLVHAHGIVQPLGPSSRHNQQGKQQRTALGHGRRNSGGKNKDASVLKGVSSSIIASGVSDENGVQVAPKRPHGHNRHATAITDRAAFMYFKSNSGSAGEKAAPVEEVLLPSAFVASPTKTEAKSPSLLTTDMSHDDEAAAAADGSDNVHSDSIVDALTAGMHSVNVSPSEPSTSASSDSASTSSISAEPPTSLHPPPIAALSVASALPPSAIAAELSQTPRSAWSRSLQAFQTLPEEQGEIRRHLLDREEQFRVSASYMNLQPELNFLMREILLDWLLGVSFRFRFRPETMMLATQLLDRFLSSMECARGKFQLVGITVLIVAAKYEESLPPTVEDFINVTDRAFAKPAILHMEGVILSSLHFELTTPTMASFMGPIMLATPMDAFVDTIMRAQRGHNAAMGVAAAPIRRDLEAELKHWVHFLALVTLQHAQFISFPPSLMAASVVALAHYQIVAEAAALERMASVLGGRCVSLQEDEEDDAKREESLAIQADADSEDLMAAMAAAPLPPLYWDAAQRDASGGYEAWEMADVIAELHGLLGVDEAEEAAAAAAAGVPLRAKYQCVIKRFQRESYAGVGARKVAFPVMHCQQ